MPDERPSHQAQVRLTPEHGEAAFGTDRIVVRHHRAPRVVWGIDMASGGHMLHLALAQCVFNNILRIAQERGLSVSDVRVAADGGFDTEGTASTGIDCVIELSGPEDEATLTDLATAAFDDSTVAAVLRRGGPVDLTSVVVRSISSPEPSTG